MNPSGRFGGLIELINYHLGLREGVELQDIYKLLHQSVFGHRHLGAGASEEAIDEEMRGAGELELEEPLIEPISVDARAGRVNLRAARRQGVPASMIAEAMRLSAQGFTGDHGALARLWRDVGRSTDALTKDFAVEEFEELTALVKARGFPALHHSNSYRELNSPAYRVLIGSELERLMRGSPASDL